MRVKIAKIIKELNVGIETVREFLKENGYDLDENINQKLPDDLYNLLIEEFGTNILIIHWRSDPFTDNSSKNRETVNSLGWNRMRNDTMLITPSRYILIPKNQSLELYDYWTHQDFDERCKNAIKRGRIIRTRLGEPSGSIPVEPYIEDELIDEPKTNETYKIYDTNIPQLKTNINVVGKINLSGINQSTRPKKKTKEERWQERLDKKRERQELKSSKNVSLQSTQYTKETIRDIWQRFVDIQERIVRQKCLPINIIPDSISIENGKMFIDVDDTKDEQDIDRILKEDLGVEEYDLSANHIFVPESIWTSTPNETLMEICRKLQPLYVELDPTPTINATISYGRSLFRTDQLTLSDLQKLDEAINHGEFIEGGIDETASFISNHIDIDVQAIKRHLFGDHCISKTRVKKDGTEKTHTRVEYVNSYIPWEQYTTYNQSVGLRCTGYSLVFRIEDGFARDKLNHYYWDCYDKGKKSFVFRQKFNDETSLTKDFLDIINYNIELFIKDALLYCNQSDITIKVIFRYELDYNLLYSKKYREIAIAIAGRQGYSFNERLGSLGIDFNWRRDDLSKIIADLENEVQFIKIKAYNDDIQQHKLKCRTNVQLANFEAIKQKLQEIYKNIIVDNDSINQQIHIKLPYSDIDVYEELRMHLEQSLKELDVAGANVLFDEKKKGRILFNMNYNVESRMQDFRDSIMDLKRADFAVTDGNNEIVFGRLINAFFEDEKIRLVFDINIEDEDKRQKIIEAFIKGLFTTVVPILTGDLEKISRLKNTFTMATTGADLINSRLQNFIFDSSEATPTSDIEYILDTTGTEYQNLCYHLLNKNVNESQKQAILKAMWADDLAVIQGPPGTGKSTAIAELIWQLIRRGLQQGNEKEFILLTSETNLAVDNAISRIVNSFTNLVKPVRFGDEEKLESEGLQFSIDLMERWVKEGDECLITTEIDEETDSIVSNNLILRNWLDNISRRSFGGTKNGTVADRWRNFLKNPDVETRQSVYQRYLQEANVIGATCSSIGDTKSGNKEFNGFTSFFHNYCKVKGDKKVNYRRKIRFTTVIQDESSKATPAELVLPFVYGKRAIVIGDHRQLPPMLDQEEFENVFEYALRYATKDVEKQEILNLKTFVEQHFEEMEISHFQRLYENIHPSLKGSFNLQYRMHPYINEVIEQFYKEDGGLQCGLITPIDLGVNDSNFSNPASRYHGIEIDGLINNNTHVLFINSKTPEMLDGTSRVNYGEINIIDKLLTRFEQSVSFQNYLSKFTKDEDKQIGIISFYGKQIRHIRNVARQHSSMPIRISTVDRFQGMERNIVIVSMVRSNLIQSSKDQLPDMRRYVKGYPTQRSLGFAQSPNRLNVALSRAKRLLIIIGNEELFSVLPIYKRLFNAIRANSNNIVVNQEEI